MFDDPRWDDSRDRDERDRESRDRSIDPRDVFMEWVDLPRGLERELVRDGDHEYTLRGSESRTLTVVGAFRVASSRDLLDHDRKREYQEFLQERNRGRADSDGRPDRGESEIEDWAREHDLPYFDGHVHFPDARIEYEHPDGRLDHLDVEVVTIHYRGSHGAAASRSGFSTFRGSSARTGGSPFDPDFADELLQ